MTGTHPARMHVPEGQQAQGTHALFHNQHKWGNAGCFLKRGLLKGMSCSSRRKHSHSPSTAVMAIAPTFTSHLRDMPSFENRHTVCICFLQIGRVGRMHTM